MAPTTPTQISQVQQVDWLLEQAQVLESGQALELIWRAHTLAQFMGYSAGVAHSLNQVARREIELERLEQATTHLRLAFEVSQQIRNRGAFEACQRTAGELLKRLQPTPQTPLPAAA
jgi:hypothetical protein